MLLLGGAVVHLSSSQSLYPCDSTRKSLRNQRIFPFKKKKEEERKLEEKRREKRESEKRESEKRKREKITFHLTCVPSRN